MRSLLISLIVGCVGAAHADVLSKAGELGVSHLTLQELAPVQARDGSSLVSLSLDGRAVVLEVSAHSVRSDHFTLVLDHGAGVTETVDPPAPRTVRGVVLGDPDSVVTGSIVDGLATLMIKTGGEWWTVQPSEDEGAGVHAVYSASDVLEHGGLCGMPTPAGGRARAPIHHMAMHGHANRGTGDLRIAEIAIEADWQLYSNFFGQNQANLLNDIDSVMAALNTIYERDVLLTMQLSHVLIRTSSASNPYTTSDASALLTQFQNEWNSNQQHVQRDVAHLWTGRNLTGSTIGIAFLGTICTSSAYGVDQIRFSTNFNSRVALFSHELGHNWNAEHCDSQGECRIMCSGLGGCTGLGNPVRFGPFAIGQINSFIPTRSCVDNIGTRPPIIADFEGGSLNPLQWGTVTGFSVITDGQAPSGIRVGRFAPPFTLIGTTPVNTEVEAGRTIAVGFSVKPESSTTRTMRVNVTTPGGGTQLIAVVGDDGSGQYRRYVTQLPGWALNGTHQIRMLPESSGPAWRIDDIEIIEAGSTDATIALPLVEDFERAGLFMDIWQPSPGEVNNGASGPPSGVYSAALLPGQRMETADALASGAGEIVFGVLAQSPAGSSSELVLSWRDAQGAWTEAGRFASSSVPSSGDFGLVEVLLPASAAHDALSVAIEVQGGAPADAWRLDDLELGGESRDDSDCLADLAPPFGVLDLGDINAFATAFSASDPLADLALPFGVFDLADVNAFVTSFVSGCP
jgi:hypothetical protein